MKKIHGYVLFNPLSDRIAEFWRDKKGAEISKKYWRNKGRKNYLIGKCSITFKK